MTILFAFSNIFIPLILLAYSTVIRLKNNTNPGYGQWFAMIIAILIGNIISFIINIKGLFLFLDLALKLSVAIMPYSINQKIQQLIRNLHLEILLQHIRGIILNKFFIVNWKVIEYALSKMDDIQKKQFKNMLTQKLTGNNYQDYNLSSRIRQSSKTCQTVVVQCNFAPSTPINTDKIVNYAATKKLQSRSVDRPPHLKNNLKQGSQNAFTKTKQPYLASSKQLYIEQPHKNIIKHQIVIKNQIIKPKDKNSQNYIIKRSTTDILDNDHQIEQKRSTKFTQQIVQMEARKKYHQQHHQNQDFSKNQKIVTKNQNQRILDQLDITISQYSEMFDDIDQLNDVPKILICKVQTIVQIGTRVSAQLEIYNLELYSNNDLKIVSLYGRQFEKHKLVSMKPLPNNYYQLKLVGGSIDKRRIKFRGPHQAFIKYLQQ